MPTKDNLLIGQMLVDEGVISAEQLEQALKNQRKGTELICTTIVRLGLAPEEEIFQVLSKQLDIPYIHIKGRSIDPATIEKVPAKFALHYKIMPLEYDADDVLVIATADPLDMRTLDDIRLLLDKEVKGVLCTEKEILESIREFYGVGAETAERIATEKSTLSQGMAEAQQVQDVETLADNASIITFVNQILSEAVKERASDIHFEPFQNELRVRFRIDGVLYDITVPETIKYFQPAIVSRIKIMSQMNIAERRLPQDGRVKIKIGAEELDLRVSVIPTAFGESVQIRLLSSQSFLELDKIGLLPENVPVIASMVKKPHGIIFVTGPTGSGKSTTLYASLAQINSSEVKIITVEDPIECQMRGVTQIQVNARIGLTFAAGLRHILRHDPDIIMVGEVRDLETAEIAIRSALTGHLVLSTLHTNDAAGTVTRLLDMGIEPFLVASSLECLIAQRLVRCLCPFCRVEVEDKESVLSRITEIKVDRRTAVIYEAKGCKECRFTGYRGRTGIHEILVVSNPIREMILKQASSQQIKEKAIASGMRTLVQDGLIKALQGITTVTEVMRVTQQEAAEG